MSKNNKVIYTSIVGGFDNLIQPKFVDDSFDYICFVKKGQTDTKRQGIWQIVEIPYDNCDNRILSRFPKLMPHKVLSQYDYSLWMDGNVSINDARLYEIIDKKIEDGILYSGVNHWGRDCAYDEAAGIANKVKEPLFSLAKTVRFLRKERFPKHYGLYENNVILRKHNNQKFDNLWWDLFCKYAKRDQLCHQYCYKKFGLDFDYLLPKEYCARNHPYFTYVKHQITPVEQKGIDKIVYDIKRKTNVLILKLLSKI